MKTILGLTAALCLFGCSSGNSASPGSKSDGGHTVSADASVDDGQSATPPADGGGGDDATTDAGSIPISDAQPAVQEGPIMPPNPLVSLNKPVVSSTGGDSTTVDGNSQLLTSVNDGMFFVAGGWEAPVPEGGAPPWVAINVGAGPTRLLVTWLTEGQVDISSIDSPIKSPVDYHIDTSPDGTTWTTVVTVTGNDTNARESAFPFTGQSWFRIVIDQADSSGSTHFVQIQAYDISNGAEETWIFTGDSITVLSMNLYQTPDFATLVNEAKPTYTPMFIDEGVGGTTTTYALAHIAEWLERFPDIRNWTLDYGTNDAQCDEDGGRAPAYLANLKILVDDLKSAGKRVIIPHIPYNQWQGCTPTDLTPYNDGIDALRTTDPFAAGPDLYTYFAANASELTDGVHPGPAGVTAMNQLWSQAVTPLYP